MSTSRIVEALLSTLRLLPPEEASAFLAEALAATEQDSTPEVWQGRPRDAAVQAYAGAYMHLHRDPELRARWVTALDDKKTTYAQLGAEAGVTRERARQLYAQLRPAEYEEQKRLRAVS